MSGSANLLLGCSGWSQHERLVVRCFGWGWHGVVLCSGWFGNTTQDRVRLVDVGGGSWCCNPKFLILSSDDISCMHRLGEMVGEVQLSLLGGQNDLWLHCQCDIAVDKILLWNGVESWRFMCPVSFQQLYLKLLNSRFESFSLTNNNEIQQTLSKDIARQHFWLRDAVGWSLRLHFYKSFNATRFFPTLPARHSAHGCHLLCLLHLVGFGFGAGGWSSRTG